MPTAHPPSRRARGRRRRVVAALCLAVPLAGCGGDDDAGDGDVQAFCDGLLALDGALLEPEGDRADAFTELAELAPEDLRPEVLVIRDHQAAVSGEGDGASGDVPAEVQAAGDRIDAFASSACDGGEPVDG